MERQKYQKAKKTIYEKPKLSEIRITGKKYIVCSHCSNCCNCG